MEGQCQIDGGLGEAQPADPEVQAICDLVSERLGHQFIIYPNTGAAPGVKAEFIEKSGVNASIFKAIEYKRQVVAGTNYFIKVDIGDGQYAHLRVFQPLPQTGESPRLDAFELGKTKQDNIDYIDM